MTGRPCAVVTGAGRGIGRAVAQMLAERKCDVALLARTVEELEHTAAGVVACGCRALTLRCDVTRADDVVRATREILNVFGAPHVLVNNAGVVRRALVQDMSEEDWDIVLNVNLKGVFLVTRAVLPHMLAKGSGRTIAIGSISSTLGTAKQGAYVAAKWGVVGFTKSLAEELRGTGLQTMCVLPGAVATQMLKGSDFAPVMTAKDVANTVVYAALDAPDAMNGSAIEIFGP
jgi:NAD(P)-dependent dehydrogenase (short-subunit alcohol dehydrogenase family)